MKVRVDIIPYILINAITIIVSVVVYIYLDGIFNDIINDITIWFLSVAGIAVFLYIIITGKKLTSKVINLYNAFLLFFFLFNFGQCLFWVFNIHFRTELGATTMYTLLPATNETIMKTQLAAIIAMLSIHTGAILSLNRRHDRDKEQSVGTQEKYKKLLMINLIICAVSGVAMLIIIIQSIQISHSFGYRSLYYGEYADTKNAVVSHISKLFIPSLFGILLFGNYEKKYRLLVYTLFLLYSLGWVACGDRGSFVFPLVTFIIMSNNYYKRISLKKYLLYGTLAIVCLFVLNAVVQVRSNDFSIKSVVDAIGYDDPIRREIMEMGGTMRTTATVIQYKEDINYPFGNTYFNSIMCMITEKMMLLFNNDYRNLSTWFSQDYLNINYGAGFSYIAEALLNYNVVALSILSTVFGYVIARLFNYGNYYKNNKIKLLSSAILFVCIAPICRGTAQTTLKTVFYTFVVYKIVVFILGMKFMRERNWSEKNEK